MAAVHQTPLINSSIRSLTLVPTVLSRVHCSDKSDRNYSLSTTFGTFKPNVEPDVIDRAKRMRLIAERQMNAARDHAGIAAGLMDVPASLTRANMDRMDRSEFLREQLKDGGLRNILLSIDTAPDREKALHHAKNGCKVGFAFRKFLDRLLMDAGLTKEDEDGNTVFVGGLREENFAAVLKDVKDGGALEAAKRIAQENRADVEELNQSSSDDDDDDDSDGSCDSDDSEDDTDDNDDGNVDNVDVDNVDNNVDSDDK